MARGQSVTGPVQVLDRMLAVERALGCDELDRGALHARMLRHVLELNALYATSRMPNEAPAQIALSMTASEARAHRLLSEALALAELPGALDALEAGLLTVEQSQHDPPATPTRPPPPIPGPHPFDELSPWQIDEELWELGLLPDDPDAFDLRAVDVDAEDVDPDPVDLWGQPPDTTWTLDLHDPYLWVDPAR